MGLAAMDLVGSPNKKKKWKAPGESGEKRRFFFQLEFSLSKKSVSLALFRTYLDLSSRCG